MNNKSKTIIKFLKEGFYKNDSNSIKHYLYNISEISKSFLNDIEYNKDIIKSMISKGLKKVFKF